MQIPYGIQTYRRADLPQIRLLNLYVEKVPDVPGNAALLPRPALAPYQSVGTGPCRALFYQDGVLNNTLFAVSGQQLYGNQALIGTIPGTGRVALTVADIYLLIANGSALYRSDGTTLTTISFPDGAGVSDVAYLGGYAIAVRAGTRRLYFTLDSSTWDGLDYVSAELSTAPIVGIQVVADQLWVFCSDHTEVFYLSGDSTAPIQRVQGRLFEKGCRAQYSIVGLDNTVFWIDHDNVAYRGESVPQRISDHGIEEAIAGSVGVEAFAYKWIGHLFYVVQLDTVTYAYDVATGQWHELGSYGRDGWRVNQAVPVGGAYVAGDDTNGQLWQLQDGVYSDNGTVIEREFTVIENEAVFLDNVVVDCSTGTTVTLYGAPGTMEMRLSRDHGDTFGDWRQQSMGQDGRWRSRVAFRRCGKLDSEGGVMQFRLTDPVPSRITKVNINESLAGRSR